MASIFLPQEDYTKAAESSQRLLDMQRKEQAKLDFQKYQPDLVLEDTGPGLIVPKDQPKTKRMIDKRGGYGTSTGLDEGFGQDTTIEASDAPAANVGAASTTINQIQNLDKLYDDYIERSLGRTGIVSLGPEFFIPGGYETDFTRSLPSFKPGQYMIPGDDPKRFLYDINGKPVSVWEEADKTTTLRIWAGDLQIPSGMTMPSLELGDPEAKKLSTEARNVLKGFIDQKAMDEFRADYSKIYPDRKLVDPIDETAIDKAKKTIRETQDRVLVSDKEAEAFANLTNIKDAKTAELSDKLFNILSEVPGPIRDSKLIEFARVNQEDLKGLKLEKVVEKVANAPEEAKENFYNYLESLKDTRDKKLPEYTKFLNVQPADMGKTTKDALDIRAGKVGQIQILIQQANIAKSQGNQPEFQRLQMLIADATQKLKLDDSKIVYLQGMQGIKNLERGDTGLASAVASEFLGVNVEYIPRNDGLIDERVNGQITRTGIKPKILGEELRRVFDTDYKTKLAEEAFRRNQAEFDTKMANSTKITEATLEFLTEEMKQKYANERERIKNQGDAIEETSDGEVLYTDSKTGVVYQMHKREYEDQEGNPKEDLFWKAIRMPVASLGENTSEGIGVSAFGLQDYQNAVQGKSIGLGLTQ